MQHQLTQLTLGKGIEAIPADELATAYQEFGYRGLYHAVYIEDCGSTVPDPYCQIYARRPERDTSQRVAIADLSLHEVEELIALLQVAKHTMLHRCEPLEVHHEQR